VTTTALLWIVAIHKKVFGILNDEQIFSADDDIVSGIELQQLAKKRVN